MERIFKKSLALILTLVLALNTAGCVQRPGQPQESGEPQQSGEPQVSGEPGEEPGETGSEYASWVNSDIQEWVKEIGEADAKDDFHLHVNREWMLNTVIPDGYSSFDTITERALEVDSQLMDILENPEKETDPALIHDQELVQKYYTMWLDWDARNKLGVSALKDLLDPLMKVQDLDDLTAYLSMPRTVISATELAQCEASMDWNNADYYAVYVMPVDLIFGDSMYYGYMEESDALDEPYYNVVIRHILVELGYSDEEATEVLKSCFAFEKDISEYIMTTEEESARDAVVK